MTAAKVDFKRELRELYAPTRTASLVQVPELSFLMVDGHGDPNTSAEYREAVSALFSVSYAARFALKRSGLIDYGVMPLEGLWLERFAEGLSAQVLHVGPYSAEGPTIAGLHEFIAAQGYERAGKHHEIYLSDPGRAAPEKLKTIIRQPVRRARS